MILQLHKSRPITVWPTSVIPMAISLGLFLSVGVARSAPPPVPLPPDPIESSAQLAARRPCPNQENLARTA